jgi:hypothetical protein
MAGRARPPKGDGVDQRRDRLRHLQPVREQLARSDIVDATRDAIAAATRANVSIYAVDPRGLATPGRGADRGIGAVVDDPSLGLGLSVVARRAAAAPRTAFVARRGNGGFAVPTRTTISNAFDRLVATTAAITCSVTTRRTTGGDGRFRKIEVR